MPPADRHPDEQPTDAEAAVRLLDQAARRYRVGLFGCLIPVFFTEGWRDYLLTEPDILAEVPGLAVEKALDDGIFNAFDLTPAAPILVASSYPERQVWEVVSARRRRDGNVQLDTFFCHQGRWTMGFHAVVLPDAHDIDLQWHGEDGPLQIEDVPEEWVEEAEDLAWRGAAAIRVAEEIRRQFQPHRLPQGRLMQNKYGR